MGTLKYAILGLLNRKEMTGYEMSKELSDTLSAFWSAKHSQIYPELRQLKEDGMVEYHVAITGNVLEKKVYAITDAGRDAFMQWEETMSAIQPFPKDEFRLKLYFSGDVSANFRKDLLENQLKQHQKRLEAIRQDLSKFSKIPPDDPTELSDYMLVRGGIIREESTCAWLQECLDLSNVISGGEVARP